MPVDKRRGEGAENVGAATLAITDAWADHTALTLVGQTDEALTADDAFITLSLYNTSADTTIYVQLRAESGESEASAIPIAPGAVLNFDDMASMNGGRMLKTFSARCATGESANLRVLATFARAGGAGAGRRHRPGEA